ncbi:MAG: hypothetical protein WCF65_06325 [Parachlamydiaceae bacterium]
MSTSNFNLRNLTPDVMSLLKKEATKQKISMNSLILSIVERGLGLTRQNKKSVFHDLDYLAGTWNSEDKKKFDDHTKSFEEIDKELWR